MWSEDINKKIQEGENRDHQHLPEAAWNGMESLLDKHLPLKKKRRRFVLWLLPTLLLTGLGTVYLLQKTRKPDTVIVEQSSVEREPLKPVEPFKPIEQNDKQTALPVSPGRESSSTVTLSPDPEIPSQAVSNERGQADNNRKNVDLTTKATTRQRENSANNVAPVFNEKNPKSSPRKDTPDLTVAANVKPANTDAPAIGKPVDDAVKENIGDRQTQNVPLPAQPVIAETDKVAEIPAEKKPADTLMTETSKKNPTHQKKPSFGDRFSLHFSFGPDVSAVGMSNPGQVQLQYGIGAGYAITKNLTVRAGFYAGDKKYTADSSDYHSSYSIANLEKVDADCFVYEIPVNLAYQFNPVKRHSWFISGGVSSYIMKKETYGYYYRNTWNQPQYYSRTYKNENKHLFTVIGLSGGYQYALSRKLNLLAEPYIKFPVSGIGAGKVKLNNTGILFTIGYKPFSKK